MAKFRQGNLVLQDTQKIIQDGVEILGGSGAAAFSTLDVRGLSTLATLTFASGATIDELSTDGTLTGDSDEAVPTEKAVKSYVDAQIGGLTTDHNDLVNLQGGDSTTSEYYHLTQSIHDALYSASPVIGLGSSTGTNLKVDYGNNIISNDIDGDEVVTITKDDDFNMVITNAYTGGALRLDLDYHYPNEDYYGLEISLISTDVTGPAAYSYVEGMDIWVNAYSSDTTGFERPDYVGAWIGAVAAQNYYGIVDGLDVSARGAIGSTADFISGLSNYVDSRGTVDELTGINTAMQLWSGTAGVIHGEWMGIQGWGGAVVDDVYVYYGEYRIGSGGATINNDVWGLYIANPDDVPLKNHIEGEFDVQKGSDSQLSITEKVQSMGGTRAGGGSPNATLNIDNSVSDDINMSMGTGNHYYQIQDVSGGEGSGVDHEWFVSGNSVARFDGLTQYLGDYSDTYVKVNQGSNEIEINNGSVVAVFGTGGGIDLYHGGVKVSETTANGITGAVWG